MDTDTTLYFFAFGYLTTALIETPILVAGLSSEHSLWRRIGCGFWLTACTYPVVILTMPMIEHHFPNRPIYLAVVETLVATSEVVLFRIVSRRRVSAGLTRDDVIVVIANVLSFLAGESGVGRIIRDLAGQFSD